MKYTHRDKSGMEWRFVGARPVSRLADEVMSLVGFKIYESPRRARELTKIKKGQNETH